MFRPLTPSDLGKAGRDARIYCRPTCFVDRPHESDDGALRLGDSLIWFSAWHISLRDQGLISSTIVSVQDWDQWLGFMPSALGQRAIMQHQAVVRPKAPLIFGERVLRFHEPQLMGILNVTPDSFSDGGRFSDVQAAVDAGFAMGAAGAQILDVGGESTRPGAQAVWEGDEVRRVEPVIAGLARGGAIVSVDTRKALVMEAALAAGAKIINDVSALRYDDRAMDVAASSDAAVVLMHAAMPTGEAGSGRGGSDSAGYVHPVLDIFDMLEERVLACEAAGISRSRLILDPGIGFGKGVADNLALLNGLALFQALGCPLLFAASRKRVIGALDGEAPADDRLGGTIALHYHALTQGAQWLRVHDVREHRQAVLMWRGLRDTALTS